MLHAGGVFKRMELLLGGCFPARHMYDTRISLTTAIWGMSIGYSQRNARSCGLQCPRMWFDNASFCKHR